VHRRILFTALLAPVLAPGAFPQSGPPPWNRRLVAVEAIHSFPGVPDLYDVRVGVLFSRGDTGTAPLNLSTRFDVMIAGSPTPIATDFASVSFGPPTVPCGPAGCENGWLCAGLNVDGVAVIGECRVFPPHPGDDAPWCQCSGYVDIPIAQQIVLPPGDEILVILQPAPGAAAEPYVPDDLWITSTPPGGVSSYCTGAATFAPCPCGNHAFLGQGCENSTGAGATLDASGSTSAAADDLVFEACTMPAGQPALLFSGLSALNGGIGVPFGDGLQCVGVGIVRLGTKTADAGGCASWGPGLAGQYGWGAGDVLFIQDWYRDPIGGPCGSGFNLSNALEVHVSP
jgi:hypothetical protein